MTPFTVQIDRDINGNPIIRILGSTREIPLSPATFQAVDDQRRMYQDEE